MRHTPILVLLLCLMVPGLQVEAATGDVLPTAGIERIELGPHLRVFEDPVPVQPLLAERDIAVNLDCAHGIYCHGYPMALNELLVEVLSNAAIHAFEGAPRQPRIDVTAQVNAESVHLSVLDNGVGIKDGDPQRLLDPFFSTKRGSEGKLGLGLYIAYGVVTHRFNGQMAVNTRPEGLEITLLPLNVNQR